MRHRGSCARSVGEGARQPMLRSSHLQNLPDAGLYGFDPTCYLGVYMPDTFWLAREA